MVPLEVDAANRVTYRVMTSADSPAVTEVLARAFFEGEPLTSPGCCCCSLKDQTRFLSLYIDRMAEEGNSVVAISDGDGGESYGGGSGGAPVVIGAFVNEDFANSDPDGIDELVRTSDGTWAPLLLLIGRLEDRLIASHDIPINASHRTRGTWLHMWMLGVTPLAKGRQVGKKLVGHSVALAKANGFQLAFAECTGAPSTHLLTK
jgi:ribosomal protein S18 acetylase RimI-like enzyme